MKKIIIISFVAVICLVIIVGLLSQTFTPGIKYYLLIIPDVLMTPSSSNQSQNNLSEVEIDLFRIIFDRLSNLNGIVIVNSLDAINKLGGYNSIFVIPKNFVMSPHIGKEGSANCFLEWKFNNNQLEINIFTRNGRETKSLAYAKFRIPLPKNIYYTTYYSTLQTEIDKLFIEVLSK